MSVPRLTVYAINGITPVIDPTAFVHPSAVLIGDVIIGAGCYVGPCASLRGDFGHIELRAGANVQDCCVVHGFPGTGTVVEEEGHIGHAAVLHGCRVERNALVGMNAVVNDNAVVGDSAIVAAMAFVKAGMVIPPRTIAAGVPARVLRSLNDTELMWKRDGTEAYQELARRSLATMQAVEPLAAPEPGRRHLELPELLPLSILKRRMGAPGSPYAIHGAPPGPVQRHTPQPWSDDTSE
jgi:phenylacetic acid degradation protein